LYLLDINIKGTKSGIDLGRIITEKYAAPFVYLTSYADKITLEEVKKTYPYGYILKPFTEDDLRVNLELAFHKYYSEQSLNDSSKASIEHRNSIKLTDREYDLLIAFTDGLTYKETAEKLEISINTVKTYQKRLFQLFSVNSKVELFNQLK